MMPLADISLLPALRALIAPLQPYFVPLLLLVPLVLGGGGIILIPWRRASAIRGYALFITLATFALSVVLALSYDWHPDHTAQLQFGGAAWWVQAFGLRFGLGLIDSISLWLVLLTTFLMPLVILGSFSAVTERVREFFFWLLVLEAAMLGVFVATDILFFYVCFEFTLVPLYFLIGIYGSTQRLKAARVFFLYTFTGSMLTFAGVLYVAFIHATAPGQHWTFDIKTLTETAIGMSRDQQMWVLLALLAGFAVKVPLFPFHTWLPLAHTEAPTAGSVILAGVLLKLGTYGLIRFAIPMCPEAVAVAAPYIATLAIIGILYTALICWVQKDLKKLIAYSSVSHLGFCVLGMFALNTLGGTGSVMYMVNHGLSTGALFLCVGMIYERFHTREMAQMSGLAKVMPVWAFFMVFFCLASVGLPGLNGFVGEFLTLLGAFDYHDGALGRGYAAIAAVGMILAAIYILHLVGKVVWGPLKLPGGQHDGSHGGQTSAEHVANTPRVNPGAGVRDLGLREIAVLTPLALGCLVLGLYPAPMLRSLERPVAEINNRAHAAVLRIPLDKITSKSSLTSPDPDTATNAEPTHRVMPTAIAEVPEVRR